MVEVSLDSAVEFVRTMWRDDDGRTFGEVVQDLASICRDGRKPAVALGPKCKQCEFRVPPALGPDQRNGFAECWSECFGVSPSEVLSGPLALDLSNNPGIHHQLSEGKWRLHDLAADFPWSGAPPVDTKSRHAVQTHIEAGLRPGPFTDVAGLHRSFEHLDYPLHFIRCHSVAQAIPSAQGRRPYDKHAFQFSHHVLYEDGRLEHHGEWLDHEVGAFPNYRFLRALRDSVGTGGGTLVHYAPHDNTVLNQIRRQLLEDPSPPDDRDELVAFVQHWATPSRREGGWSPHGPRLELCGFVRATYYCASMRGSYALKAVLAAVLQGSEVLERRFGAPVYGVEGGMSSSNFVGMQWFCRDADGLVADPYSLIPANSYLPPVIRASGHRGDNEDDGPKIVDISALDGSAQQESAFPFLWNRAGQEQSSGGDEVALSRPVEDLDSQEEDLDSEEAGASLAWTLYSRLQLDAVEDEERAGLRQELLRTGELDTLALAMILLHLQSLAAQEA